MLCDYPLNMMHCVRVWRKNGGEDSVCPYEANVLSLIPNYWSQSYHAYMLVMFLIQQWYQTLTTTINILLFQFFGIKMGSSYSATGLRTCWFSLKKKQRIWALGSTLGSTLQFWFSACQGNLRVSSLRSFPHSFHEQSVWRIPFMHAI